MSVFLISFLLLIVPGFMAVLVYELISGHKIKYCYNGISAAFSFDFLIFIINLFILHFCYHICKFEVLICKFDSLCFTLKYAILSIIIGILLAVIASLLYRLCSWRKSCKIKKLNKCV